MVDRHLDGGVSLGSLNQRAGIADHFGPPRFIGGAAIFREQEGDCRHRHPLATR